MNCAHRALETSQQKRIIMHTELCKFIEIDLKCHKFSGPFYLGVFVAPFTDHATLLKRILSYKFYHIYGLYK